MRIALILIFLFTNQAWSDGSIYANGIMIEGKPFQFSAQKKLDVYLSQDCFVPAMKQKCQAEDVIENLSYKDFLNNQEQYANPGRSLCLAKKGKIVRGKTKDKSEISFCIFADKSLVSLNSMVKVALSKGKK